MDGQNCGKLFSEFGPTAVAAVAAAIAVWQVGSSQKSQREATTIGIWKEYLNLAFENPQFAEPEPFLIIKGKSDERFPKYEWFVSAMLFACEQVLLLEPKNKQWRAAVESQLAPHTEYFFTVDFVPDYYSNTLQEMIDEHLAPRSPHPGIPEDRHRSLKK
jgi:hypothetical protein